MSKKIILDCDPGIDDIVALMLVLQSPELELLAVTIVAGNRTVERCGENALKLLEQYGRTHIPVYLGAENPLLKVLPKDDVYSGRDGMAEVFLPYAGTRPAAGYAPDVIAKLLCQYPGEVTILSTGPMTNLALAYARHPACRGKAAGMITINGNYGVRQNPGRCDSRIEWNVLVDPEAAKAVLESGEPIVALGVDVTGTLSSECYTRLLEATGAGTLPHHLLVASGNFLRGRHLPAEGIFVDAMAVAYLLEPTLAKLTKGRVAVETQGTFASGYTRFDNVGNLQNESQIAVAYQFEMERFLTLLGERVFKP